LRLAQSGRSSLAPAAMRLPVSFRWKNARACVPPAAEP
jgi:hypothetical protein